VSFWLDWLHYVPVSPGRPSTTSSLLRAEGQAGAPNANRNYIDDFIMVDLARNGVSGHRGFASICRIVVYHRLDKQKKRVHVYASYKTCTYCNCKCCWTVEGRVRTNLL